MSPNIQVCAHTSVFCAHEKGDLQVDDDVFRAHEKGELQVDDDEGANAVRHLHINPLPFLVFHLQKTPLIGAVSSALPSYHCSHGEPLPPSHRSP